MAGLRADLFHFIQSGSMLGRYVKRTLLSLSLLVNHSVAVVFLYLPKIYAAVHLIAPEDTLASQPTRELTGNRQKCVKNVILPRFLSRRSVRTTETVLVASAIPEGHVTQQQNHNLTVEGQGPSSKLTCNTGHLVLRGSNGAGLAKATEA
ncbi:hypothetical protein PoB_003267900 [Plakobranchus ocellatus]|uniref:G-protein coupled receptors family 1 profile domain-containing protein n=1 Tax=Plakobranchus ocellatus TaxID=259542 RepID=A0AAV4AIB1_9GAST|nr:hypothetical protein PoB_003267900 [Plakobranchus ocellatus]